MDPDQVGAKIPGDELTSDAAQAAEPDGRMAHVLRLSDYVFLESFNDDHAILANAASGVRLRVKRRLYETLKSFRTPRTIERCAPAEESPLGRVFGRLIRAGVLVDALAESEPVIGSMYSNVAQTLFGCPRYRAGTPTDVTVVGIPYDVEDPDARPFREAPAIIRGASLEFEYRLSFDTTQPEGWFDVESETRILEGVSFSDRGDVRVEYGKPRSAILERICDAVEQIVADRSCPVILGGGEAITGPIASRLRRYGEFSVLRLAGSQHLNAAIRDSTEKQSGTRCSGADGGGDGLVDLRSISTNVPGGPVLSLGQRALDVIPPGSAVYLSVNLGACESAMSPYGRGSSSFTFDGLMELLDAITGRWRLLALELVCLDTYNGGSRLMALTACHVVLRALANLTTRKAGGRASN
jgi:agmatinase